MKPFLVTSFVLLCCGSCQLNNNKDYNMEKAKNLHHFSFRSAFMSGLYVDDFTLNDLLKKGDFGLGTFNNLDGEMIVLEGKIFRAKTDGGAEQVEDMNVKTPSATVTFFAAERTYQLEKITFQSLKKWLTEQLQTDRKMYAIKITGKFNSVKTRSQYAVYQTPFPVIDEIIDNMVYHDQVDLEGTLVGFQLPPYLQQINYPGLHFHFVSKNGSAQLGGCAPQFTITDALVEIMELNSFSVDIPRTVAYDSLIIVPEKAERM